MVPIENATKKINIIFWIIDKIFLSNHHCNLYLFKNYNNPLELVVLFLSRY